jgi:putative endopeptidase
MKLIQRARAQASASLRLTPAALMCCALLAAIPPSLLAGSASAADMTPRPTPSGMDTTVLPGNDFDAYANGGWIRDTAIPSDRGSWSVSGEMAELTGKQVRQLIEQAAQAAPGSLARKVGDYYNAYMDEASIEAKGTAPLKPLLGQIAAIGDKRALAHHLGANLRADVDPLNATNFYTSNLFGLWVAQGLHDEKHNTAYLLQGGLGMPDRDYYTSDSPKMAELRQKYEQHIAAMLTLAGIDDANARAARIMALEMRIAQSHASRDDSSDVLKADQRWSRADLARKARGMDWNAYFDGAGLGQQRSFGIWHPGALKGEAALVAAVDLDTWKDYLRFHLYNSNATTLTKAFVDQRFAFYGSAMAGTPAQSARWKRALAATDGALDEAVGKLYVEKYFPAQTKARVQSMVANVIEAFGKRLDALGWMAPATKAEARAKLKTLYVGVGYPDKWKDYTRLEVAADDAFGNRQRAARFDYQQALAKLKQPVDATEWSMPPHVVNAVNMPLQNAMNFPAAHLQAPSFDPQASDAVNYGAIGAIIGHEISHSFDDQGAQFDAKGRLRNWWSKDDLAHFEASSKALVAQFSAYRPFPDLALNGQQVLSENIADLAGLTAAFDAYRKAAKAGDAATVKEQDRAFFIAFAQSWRGKQREKSLRQQIATDGHAPGQYRLLTVRNLDAWYEAFDVKPGQSLYLAPAERVKVF